MVYGVATVATVYPVASYAIRLKLKQRWSRQLVGMLGIRLHMPWPAQAQSEGLLVANHISWLDVFVINAVAPSGFVSKDDVKAWPLIGWLCQHTETIFLERGNRRAAHRTAEIMNDRLKAGGRIVVFPEGTTSFGDQVLPFHGALIQAAVETGCPVQPVALRYVDPHGETSVAPAYVGDTSLWECLKAISTASDLRAETIFLDPVSPAGQDRRHLAATLHRHIAKVVVKHQLPVQS